MYNMTYCVKIDKKINKILNIPVVCKEMPTALYIYGENLNLVTQTAVLLKKRYPRYLTACHTI